MPKKRLVFVLLFMLAITLFMGYVVWAASGFTEATQGDGEIEEKSLWFDKDSRQFINRISEDRYSIRFKTRRDDVTSVSLHYKDELGYHVLRMNNFAFDFLYDYWRSFISIKGKKFEFYFTIKDGNKTIWFGPDGPKKEASGFISCDLEQQKIFQTPDWVKDAIFYQIFPDRFYNGNPENDPELIETYKNKTKRYPAVIPEWHQGILPADHNWIDPEKFSDTDNSIHPKMGWHVFYGGDLQGILKKIPYLKKLGLNAIYLNPVFEATSNHRYNTMGYEFIDDNLAIKNDFLASEEFFKKFIRVCHNNGIRVILDAVFNHTGYEHYAFQDVVKNGPDSPYADWYFVWNYPVVSLYEQRVLGKEPNYRCWWGFGSLPRLNVKNPEVKEYLFSITRKWMDPDGDGDPSDGIDGWRLDVANEVDNLDPNFWSDWRAFVKEINPGAYITGEIWNDASYYLRGDKFDGVMNYRFREAVLNFINGKGTAGDFAEELSKINFDYPEQAVFVLQNLLGSHDTARFLSLVKNNKEKLKLAVLIQFTHPGAPMIYYGDEIGMKGSKDPDCRRTMIWKERPGGKKPDLKLFDFYSKLAEIRKSEDALRRGDVLYLIFDGRDKVFGMKREYGKDLIIILLNAGEKTATLDLNLPEGKNKMRDLLTGELFLTNGSVKLELNPYKAFIFKVN